MPPLDASHSAFDATVSRRSTSLVACANLSAGLSATLQSTARSNAQLPRDPVLAEIQRQCAELVQHKAELLRQQAAVSSNLHHLLAGSGGLNYHAERSRRNVAAALSVAKRPGYFKYYQAPPATVATETGNIVSLRVSELQRIQEQVDLTDADLRRLDKELKAHQKQHDPGVGSFTAWFATYNRPENLPSATGFPSQFKASTHRYGGTKHYPPFQSVASKLVIGRAFQ